MSETRPAYGTPASWSEDEFLGLVIDLAHLAGWRVLHQRPCKTAKGWRSVVQGDAGYPDLTLAKNGRVIFAELKSQRGVVEFEQARWLAAIEGEKPGNAPYIWRPRDLDTIKMVLGVEDAG